MQFDVDYLIIGGGFYGCALALFLRSLNRSVMIVESGPDILTRASRVNQARVHAGFHYPRSVLTSVKSMRLNQRFAKDFPEAIVDNFQMLYAVSQNRSKVSAKRFFRMFSDMGASIAEASAPQKALFNSAMVEGVFACDEFAFDYSILAECMRARIYKVGIDLRLSTTVTELTDMPDGALAQLSSGAEISARYAFNVTYSQLNRLLRSASLPEANLKHELTELALVTPPGALAGIGITVMDGPFFSLMPYPAENLYSLTHVRYTPHESWTDAPGRATPYELLKASNPESRVKYMVMDGRRYLPCLEECIWRKSFYEVKSVLIKNEFDDGRPILFQRSPVNSHVLSIMGAKIDNIYDLFDLVRQTEPEWADADARYVHAS